MPALVTYALLTIPLIGAYAMFALGVSVIYRASRVLNLAHGAIATVPAYIAYSLSRAGVPIFVVVVTAIACGAGLGILVERVFVRRLRPQGPTAQTVGTVAVTGLLIAFTAKIWGTTPLVAPKVFPEGSLNVGNSGIKYGELGLFFTAAVVSIALFAFFRYTDFGLAMRGAAVNRRAASLMGIDPDLAAAAAWGLGGGLAAFAGVMLAAVTNLDPYNLSFQVLPAFVGALVGGLESLPGALWGSALAGLAFGIVPYFSGTPGVGSVASYSGAPQLALTFLALIVMGLRGRRISGVETSHAGLAGVVRPFKPLASKSMRRGLLVAAVFIIVWPLVVPFSVLGTSLNWITLSLAAMSLVVLTGWVGQISLAQASFVGIAALITGLVSNAWGLGFPVSSVFAAASAAGVAMVLGIVALRVRGLYLAVATLIFAWMCDAFLFKTPWFGSTSPGAQLEPQRIGDEAGFPYFDLTRPKTLFWLIAPLLAIVVFFLANLRDTKTGRAFFAVRGSEMAAASLGISVVRTKLVAFAIAGAGAGLAGNVLMLDLRVVGPDLFFVTISLQFLAIAVVGGLGSIGGALGAAAIFAGLDELFFRVTALAGWLDVVSAGLLAVVLLAYPGGLAALQHSVGNAGQRFKRIGRWFAASPNFIVRFRERHTSVDPSRKQAPGPAAIDGEEPPRPRRRPLRTAIVNGARSVAALARRLTDPLRRRFARARAEHRPSEDWLGELETPEPVPAEAAALALGDGELDREDLVRNRTLRLDLPEDREQRTPVVEASEITVRFGGLLAVNGASLTVREGEITGLIGPNGAGKTTLFNAILGLNDPKSGTVKIFSHDATELQPHMRARLGVARTFQVLQLFNELSVFDNLLVATHPHNRSSLFSNLTASPQTLLAEASARKRVRRVLRMLGLEDIAHHGVRGLPFGTLRMVELGRALVTGAKLIMLDEPASGLNEAETDRLSAVVSSLRALGISVLLIEHDVRMVTGICDYVYVLDQGQMIAEGTAAQIQRDPRVVAAYLGEPAEPEREKAGV
jgi:sulfate-transporting ATPase